MSAPHQHDPYSRRDYGTIRDALTDAEHAAILLTDAISDADGLLIDPATLDLAARRVRKLVSASLRAAIEAGI